MSEPLAPVMMPQSPTPQEPNSPPSIRPVPPVTMPEPDSARCGTGGYFVSVGEQSEFNALSGCEEIQNLDIYAPLDLRPLASLRRVGILFLRGVAALDGLEGLEQVGTLALTGRALRDLTPLLGLRDVQGLQVAETSLVDLTGLENMNGLTSFVIQNNAELQTLSGLVVADVVDAVTIIDNPVLRDVTSLGPMREVWYLELARNPS